MPIYQLPDEPVFPDPNEAEKDGLLAVGGDLTPQRIVNAYASGIFPWYSEDQPILWFSPDPRMVLMPENFKLSNSLKRIIHSDRFEVRIDRDFPSVINACSKTQRPGQDGTWITSDMISAYIDLSNRGIAHSFECYRDGKLVGGLYGLSLGAAFFGESMFHHESDASKVAFAKLVEFCAANEFHFIDAQQPTNHLRSLGAKEMPRGEFLERLDRSLLEKTMQSRWSEAV